MAVKILTIQGDYAFTYRLGYPISPHMGNYAHRYDNDVIIRWGNSYPLFTKEGEETDFAQVINPAKSIKLNCRKNESIKLLAQVVNIPTLYEKTVPKEVLAVIRPIFHAAGNGFCVKKGPLKLERGTYGTRFLKTDSEYRVWFCGKRTFCGKREKIECNKEQEYPCRSEWGYNFYESISSELHHQTLMAAKQIGLECGAADVLYYKKKWYFLELNSGPCVDHRRVIEFYQKSIEELVEKKFHMSISVVKLKPEETKTCISLIEEGNAVDVQCAKEELPYAPMVVVKRDGQDIVGVGTIKQVRPLYAQEISKHSGVSFDKNMHELGYVAVKPSYQKQGIAGKIVEKLVSEFKDHPLFATTSHEGMRRILKKAGFVKQGKEWNTKRGNLISLWIKETTKKDSPLIVEVKKIESKIVSTNEVKKKSEVVEENISAKPLAPVRG